MKSILRITAILLVTLFATAASFAQSLKVSGKVTQKSDGESIIGATVHVPGTNTATVTDIDGNFILEVPAGSRLQFTYLGMRTIETDAQSVMNVALEEDATLVEEVVVTGYTTQKKADLTGSVAVVDTKTLATTSDSDPMRALQGKVAGMTVTTTGSPSGTGTVRIRGIGSFNSGQDPLYVIDGMPTTQTLNSLNSADIESIQVLKDAASASIYGSRAANGVIIITTKKGKKDNGKVKVDVSANWTASFYNKQTMMDLSNTAEYATAMAQAALNDGLDPVNYAQNYGMDFNAAAGVKISAWDPATSSYKEYTVNGLYDGYINSKKTMLFSDTDWLDVISRTGFIQNYDVTLSRATDNGSSLFSVGYKRNNGILKYTNFENISTRLNTTYDITKYVSIGENLTVTHTNQVDCAPMENALKMAPIIPVYEIDGATYAGPVGGMSDRQNPMRELEWNKDNSLGVLRIFGNGYIEVKPIEGLSLKSNFGVDFDASFIHSITKTFTSDIVKESTPSSTVTQTNNMRWNWSNTAAYSLDVLSDHHFDILAGFELYKQNCTNVSAYAEDYAVETLDYMWPDAATGVQKAVGNSNGYALASFFGKVDYNWAERILASFTIRHDGSSRFGENHKYGDFPSATLGYRISQDLKRDWLDDLKVRLSWGKTGNQEISNTARYSIFVSDYGDDRVTSTAYDLNLQGSGIFPSGYRTTQSANPNLKWETTTQYNVGVDFTVLSNRLTGSVDFYIKDIDDMLISPAYLGSKGEGGASWLNGPSLRNTGMEFAFGWKDKLSCGLGYKVNFNLDFYRNHVTYLPGSTTGSYAHTSKENLVEAKKPYGSIVGYVVEGLFQSREEVLASGQDNARVGGLKYADLDGNGVINSDDQTWIYNPVPDFSYGINVELNYKNFDFSMFWQGVAGQDVYNNQKFQTDFFSITDPGSNKGSRMLGAWTTDNTSSTIPALTTNNTADEGRASSYYVENGSYLKLRTMQLGYNLDKKLMNKLHLSQARIYASGNNLLTAKSSSLTCPDPENPNWAYPTTTSFTLGIQLGF